jgi:hypothetical protein
MEFTVTCKIYDSYEDQDSGRKGDLDARNPLNHAKMRTSSTLPALFYPYAAEQSPSSCLVITSILLLLLLLLNS